MALFNFIYELPFDVSYYLTGERYHIIGALVVMLMIFTAFGMIFASFHALWRLWEVLGPYKYYNSEVKQCTGKIKALDYERERSSTSLSPVIGGKGGVAVNYNHSPEEFNVVISSKILGQKIFDNETLFEAVEIGDEVKINYIDGLRARKDGSGKPIVRQRSYVSVVTKDGRKISL